MTYQLGVRERARLCAIRGFPSSGSESTAGDTYYVDGARGDVIVQTQAVRDFIRLLRRADRQGVALSAASSFRTHRHQQELCREDLACRRGNYLLVAPAGWSNHQSGLAVDMVGTRVVGARSCGTGRARDPDSPVWRFMEQQGRALGLRQYAAESWHWESQLSPHSADRC
jgi:hypothetical protein